MLLGEHGVALAKSAIAAAFIISTNDLSGFGDSHSVLVELANADVTVIHASTLETVLVLFASCVEGINRGSLTRIRHWSITEDQTVAAIGPVLLLVE